MDSVVLESEKKNVAEKHTSWNKRYSPFVKYLILNIVWYYSMHITAWELSEERKKSCILCGDVIRVAYANRARCTKKIEHSKPLLGPAREHISSTETITLGKCSKQCFFILRTFDSAVIRLRRAEVEAPTQPILPTTISTFHKFDGGSKERREHKVFQLLSISLFNALRAQSHLSGSFDAIVHWWCKRQTQTRIMTQCNNGKHQQKYVCILKRWQKQQYQQRCRRWRRLRWHRDRHKNRILNNKKWATWRYIYSRACVCKCSRW